MVPCFNCVCTLEEKKDRKENTLTDFQTIGTIRMGDGVTSRDPYECKKDHLVQMRVERKNVIKANLVKILQA